MFRVWITVLLVQATSSVAFATARSCGSALNYVKFRQGIDSLRTKPREGWIRRGIPADQAETIWDHSKKVAKAAELLLARRFPDLASIGSLMGQFHDIVEHGSHKDFTPADALAPETKQALERAALMELFLDKPTAFQKKVVELWEEYEAGVSLVSVLVRDLDKIDAGIQAMVYWNNGYKQTEDFFAYTLEKIKDKELLSIFENLLEKLKRNSLQNPYGSYYSLLETGFK